MEMILGAMVVALLVKAVPAAVVDTFATLRAAWSGEWGLIDKERDRKHQRSASRREAVSKAWQATRARRNKKAGGDGNYRPGMAAYLGDVYHGLWEDKLEKRHAKRAARPPVGPDGRRPAVGRLDQAVEAKVGRQREKTGLIGRAARLLIDPVGEKRQPADVVPPQLPDRDDGGAWAWPSDPWPPAGGSPVSGDEPTVDLGRGGGGDGPRIACPVCGEALIETDGGWRHPAWSTCESAKQPAPSGERGEAAASPDTDRTDNEATGPTSNGGTTMTDNTDLLDYTTAVAEHEQVLAKLREQRAEATAFRQHITGATTAVEHMDGNRGVLATGLSAIAEGMEGSRFGADATSGSAEAAGALSAGSIAAVQEHIEAANDTNDRWITELDASIEGVQASLQHLKSTYGEAAATVQETGVDARALAEH